jgi:hypothetical protein
VRILWLSDSLGDDLGGGGQAVAGVDGSPVTVGESSDLWLLAWAGGHILGGELSNINLARSSGWSILDRGDFAWADGLRVGLGDGHDGWAGFRWVST